MINRSTDDLKDYPTRAHVEHLQAEAQGNILILSAAPTSSASLLQNFETGQYGNDLWFRVGNNLYKITADQVIAIT